MENLEDRNGDGKKAEENNKISIETIKQKNIMMIQKAKRRQKKEKIRKEKNW